MLEVVCWIEMFDVSGRTGSIASFWGIVETAIMVWKCTVTLLLNVALSHLVSGRDSRISPHCARLTRVQLYHVMRCWKSYDVPKYGQPRRETLWSWGLKPWKEGIAERRRSAGTDGLFHKALSFLLLREQDGVTDLLELICGLGSGRLDLIFGVCWIPCRRQFI